MSNKRVTFGKSVLKGKEHSVDRELWANGVVKIDKDWEKPWPLTATVFTEPFLV